MAWEEEAVEEEEYGEEMAASESEAEDVVVGQMPTVMVPKHINKRSLKNKALSVTLDKKALKDFVTGFHKRKKKRRKEAQKVLQEKERKKRIEERKRRKQEKEIALYGRVLSSDDAGLENEDIGDDGEEINDESLSEIKIYEDDGTRITVTTSEITPEDDDIGPRTISGPMSTSYTSKNPSSVAKKNSSLGVKKKPQKRMFKNKSKAKKGDKKRGAVKGKRKGKGRK
ncbi:hypothetical protein PAHAL_9G462600 [Panicum hallii]|uniref:Ribosomal RNA-processing protein 17 n=1 Tax=Panicum hallii TaxID=206008 RepID=A0A2S3IR42_9POAL|nr:ribosomal RNA-processing protein 17-like isoform X1 [Panicum hallii]PAN49644.1 hypothetical protein PAHAL_9G462600 [Panicum hallii]